MRSLHNIIEATEWTLFKAVPNEVCEGELKTHSNLVYIIFFCFSKWFEEAEAMNGDRKMMGGMEHTEGMSLGESKED